MSGLREVRIEKLAPTGEGIARTAEGVGFVDGALPGERVATTLYEMRKRYWRGSLRAVLEPSPDRVDTPHAGCAGCDWAHFAPGPARLAKRELFLESMQRIGKLDPSLFGELPIAGSAPEYRLRARFHLAAGRVGYYAPGTHRVVSAAACEALSAGTRDHLPAIEEAARSSGATVSEIALLESVDGSRRLVRAAASGDPSGAARLGEALSRSFEGVRVRTAEGKRLLERGERALSLSVGGRAFSVSVDSFFQGNRFLLETLFGDVAAQAREAGPGPALDAFGGVGLFAGALLAAGNAVQSVEADAGAADDAGRTREAFDDGGRWEIGEGTLAQFLAEDDRRFDLIVADPPRSGLGVEVAGELARRAKERFLYVSCDPATLARDLPILLAAGFSIRDARLYDLFAFTHRVEALIALERAA
ncbi:MAG TPA: TRAM domain-containing protein [Thermoanaerobaculia bacterium]